MLKIPNLILLIASLTLFGCSSSDENPYFSTGRIEGGVADKTSGHPIANATITLSPGSHQTLSASNGNYSLNRVPIGKYNAICSATGYQAQKLEVVVEKGAIAHLYFRLTKSGSQTPDDGDEGDGNDDNTRTPDDGGDNSNENPDDGNDDNTQTPDNPGQNITAGLYGLYPFEQSGQNSYTAGGAPHATEEGYPYYGTGYNGYALHLEEGGEGSLHFADPMLDTGTFTLSCWMCGVGDGHLFHTKLKYGKWSEGFILLMANGRLTYITNVEKLINSTSEVWSFEHPSLASDEWTMVTLTSKYSENDSSCTYKLYLNGAYVDTYTEQGVLYCVGYGDSFCLGGEFSFYSGRYTVAGSSMKIDNLRIYHDRVLKDTEIAQLYEYER